LSSRRRQHVNSKHPGPCTKSPGPTAAPSPASRSSTIGRA